MGYYIRNNSLFVVDGGETKDELITYVIESTDTVTRLDDVPGTLDKTLYNLNLDSIFTMRVLMTLLL